MTFEPDALPNKGSRDREVDLTALYRADDNQHQWHTSGMGLIPPQCAIDKVFVGILGEDTFGDDEEHEAEWWRQLPLVPAVTRLLIRLQTRRRWDPLTLVEMVARLPRLREFHYETWREWDGQVQEDTDGGKCFHPSRSQKQYTALKLLLCLPEVRMLISVLYIDYLVLFESAVFQGLRSFTIFENTNQQYGQQYELAYPQDFSLIRTPKPALSQTLHRVSVNLEALSGSFMVDARDFFTFDVYQPSQNWPNLHSLVLTSQIIAPYQNHTSIMSLLQAAASAPIHMPQLRIMEIWNGQEKFAALFRYELISGAQPSIITWRGTCKVLLQPPVIRAWEAVVVRSF